MREGPRFGGSDVSNALLLVDDLPCPDAVINPREIADVGCGIGIEHDKVRVVSGLQRGCVLRLEERRGIGGERGKNVAPVHAALRHQHILFRRVVVLRVADVGAEKDRSALLEIGSKFVDAPLDVNCIVPEAVTDIV